MLFHFNSNNIRKITSRFRKVGTVPVEFDQNENTVSVTYGGDAHLKIAVP